MVQTMAAGLNEEVVQRIQVLRTFWAGQVPGTHLVDDEQQSRTSDQFLRGMAK